MEKREFLKLSAAIGATAFAPNLFAKQSINLFGAPALPSVVIAVAALQGEASKLYDIDFKIWRTPDQLRAGVANGVMKATMAPSNVAANLFNQGLNFKMLNVLTFGLNWIMAKDESIKSYEDLVGKKLVMPFKNDMPDIVLRASLKKLGVDVNKIDITYVATPPEALGLFLQKGFDAALLLEPLSSASILRGKRLGLNVTRAINIQERFKEAFGENIVVPQAGIIVESDFYTQNRAFFDLFEKDLKEALKWIEENKQSAADIGANYLPAPVPALVDSFKNANLTAIRASEIKDEIMKFFEIIYEYNPKLIGGKMPSGELFL